MKSITQLLDLNRNSRESVFPLQNPPLTNRLVVVVIQKIGQKAFT